MTRPRLAKLQGFAAGVAQAARRRAGSDRRGPGTPPPPAVDGPAADELARRLDATRERLRRDIPPPDSEESGGADSEESGGADSERV